MSAAAYYDSAMFYIRQYLWSQLTSSEILAGVRYVVPGMAGSFNPIIPVQQLPETNDLLDGNPFIVYDTYMPEQGQDFWMREEEVVFAVYDSNYARLMAIVELMKDIFGRMDDSAREINGWTAGTSFNFKWCRVVQSDAQDPTRDEAGRLTAYIQISYCYTRNDDALGRFA